jgi:hypothetical protein
VTIDRRSFLASMGLAVLSPHARVRAFASAVSRPDHSLRIEPCTIDIGNGVQIKTVA